MTVDMNNIALGRQQQFFVVKETTPGTLVDPVASDLVRPTEFGKLWQKPEMVKDPQARNTRSRVSTLTGRLPPGAWEIPTLLKPSGVLGSVPEQDVLLECLFGTKTLSTTMVLNSPTLKTWTTGTHTGVTQSATSGSGVNMEVTIVVAAGVPGLPTITAAGTGYAPGDTVTFADPNGNGADIVCTLANPVATFASMVITTWATSSTLTTISPKSTSGSGVSMVVTITTSRLGVPTAITVTSQGSGYVAGDTVTFADPGTDPDGADVYGTVAASNIVYALADTNASLSIWRDLGHTMYAARGATVDVGEFTVAGDKIGDCKFSGEFMEMAFVGTDTVGTGGISDAATTLPVTNHELFHIGSSSMWMYITVGTEVMKVTAVDHVEGTLTVVRAQKGTSAAAHLADVAITPWALIGTERGYPVHGTYGTITCDGIARRMIDAKITVKNGIKYITNEKTGTRTAESFVAPQDREVTVTANTLVRTTDIGDWYKALNKERCALQVNLGETSGYILRFDAPHAQVDAPDQSNSEGMVTQTVNFSLEIEYSSSNEELTLTAM